MEETTTKEQILKKVRNAIIHKSDNPFPKIDSEKSVFNEPDENKEVAFAKAFTAVGGKFIYCPDEKTAMLNLKSLVEEYNMTDIFTFDKDIQTFLDAAKIKYNSNPKEIVKIKVGITFCESLISRFGSVVISTGLKCGRRMPAFAEAHIVLAFCSQIVPGIKEALAGIKNRYGKKMPSMISTITGPSRTADIEKTLVMGAHGPKNIFVFLIDDNK